jgi:CRISPR type III-A-associated protein Csm2
MIQADYAQKREDILLLKPRLAYNAARNRSNPNQQSSALEMFFRANAQTLTELSALGEAEFSRYASIMEAFVAFHKFFGGK